MTSTATFPKHMKPALCYIWDSQIICLCLWSQHTKLSAVDIDQLWRQSRYRLRKPTQPCRTASRTQTGIFLLSGQTWRDTRQLSFHKLTSVLRLFQRQKLLKCSPTRNHGSTAMLKPCSGHKILHLSLGTYRPTSKHADAWGEALMRPNAGTRYLPWRDESSNDILTSKTSPVSPFFGIRLTY